MKYKRKISKKLENITIIKNHPVVIYLSAIVTGFIAAFSILAYLNLYMGFELEKKGTYINYRDFHLILNDNYIPKLYYENILNENNNLRILLEKYSSKDSDSIIAEIYLLKDEQKKKTEELIQYTTSMQVSFDESIINRNTNTEKYRLLSEEIKSIQKTIDSLYEKL